ncbi:MAG: DUF721 domain-containing protein [Rhizobiaceae bacterium]
MKKTTYFQPLGGSISKLLDPLLAKRSHVDAALALSWPDIAGEKLAGRTQPLKVTWPRRTSPDDPFEPGTLTVACEGAVALDLQYQTSELINRINGFFGYSAIARIKIEQRAVDGFRPKKSKQAPTLDAAEKSQLLSIMSDIEDKELREALLRLGTSVKSEKAKH